MKEAGLKEIILVNDVGTTSVRTCAIDISNGSVVCQESHKYAWHHTKEGWTTMDPYEIWNGSVVSFGKVLDEIKNDSKILAITFSYIGDSTILADAEGNALYEMIPAFDSRAQQEIAEIRKIVGNDRYIELTGGPVELGCMSGKILWLQKHEKELFKQKVQYFSIQQFFNARMGLKPVNDYSLASRKTMYDSMKGCWASEILEKLNISEEELGKVISADFILGEINRYGDVELPYQVPVILGAHDSECGLYGAGVSVDTPEYIANIAGTFDHLEFLDHEFHNYFPIYGNMMFRAPLKGDYVSLDASIAGSSIQWFLENIYGAGENPFDDLYGHIEFNGENRLVYLPGLEDSNAMFQNLNASHTKYDMYQAIIEGITYKLKQTTENYAKIHPGRFRAVRAGGGGCKAAKWMQLKADMFGMPVEVAENLEISSVGSAAMAAVGIGAYKTMKDATDRMVSVGKVYEPNTENAERYAQRFAQYKDKYMPLKKEL